MLAPPASRAGVARPNGIRSARGGAAAGNGGVERSMSLGGNVALSTLGVDFAQVRVGGNGNSNQPSPRPSEAALSSPGSGAGELPPNLSLAAASEDPSSRPFRSPSPPAPGLKTVQVKSAQGVTPLHLRMVSDVDFIVYPFSLIFVDPALEMDYLKTASQRVSRHIRRTALALLLFFGLAIAFDASQYTHAQRQTSPSGGESGVYLTKLILTSVAAFVSLLFALMSRLELPFHPLPQAGFILILSLIGGLWAVSANFRSDKLLESGTEVRVTESGGFVVFLVILHGVGRWMYFHLLCIPSFVSTVVYVVCAVYWSPQAEAQVRLAWGCCMALVAMGAGWYASYRVEFLARWAHLVALKVELSRREKADLRKEAFDLRDESQGKTSVCDAVLRNFFLVHFSHSPPLCHYSSLFSVRDDP
jgi:hypothetical protein